MVDTETLFVSERENAMKTFIVSRCFSVRQEWIVDAESAEEAKSFLDDVEYCDPREGNSIWMGPSNKFNDPKELSDFAQELTE